MNKILAQIFLSPIAKQAFKQAAEVFIEVAATQVARSILSKQKNDEPENDEPENENENIIPFELKDNLKEEGNV